MNFPKSEEKVVNFWREQDAFHTQNKLREGRPRFNFYDGPPFATGLPHYGHILASTIKDTVTRDAVMNNYYVERRFGWDTHGLPVEHEIDKKFNVNSFEDVKKMGGIKAYNSECRKIVMTYADQWENTIERLGRWIDFKNDYKTLYPEFMESVWWVFKQLYDKGLVYQGVKVMPYSTKCTTSLSNFEVTQNYKNTQDPVIVVNFPLLEEPDVYLTAWTTTPWTLPSNLATCVHPDLDYVKVYDKERKMKFILMEARICELYKSEEEYDLLDKFKGITLKGKQYKPLFDYFAHYADQGAFRVCCDKYVTTDAGTGIVHQSPFNGADDYRVAIDHGYIKKDGEVVCPLDAAGRFTEEVPEFQGMYVKDADKHIIKHLKDAGRVVKHGTVEHNYPFCWRSDTPIIYRAMPSWFIRVEDYREDLLASNKETYWVPSHVQEKRFHNWLANANDWAVSRSRYWGTPIPIWCSEDMQEMVCIGSIKELEELSGQKVTDLHRENIDHIKIPSAIPGNPPLKRIHDVFDCWFESGSMPYAQQHYPFENKKQFEDSFPAEFIAEGIDQTRGWFYTLTVIGTLLYGRSPFKNVIVNGLVLTNKGTKMSKRLKNYTDPGLLINEHGADALRLYLINSPVVRAEDLKFEDKGVKDIVKDVFLPWFNVYKFAVQTALQYEHDTGKTFQLTKAGLDNIDNDIDKWILSELGSLVKFVQDEMSAYRLYTVTPKLVLFIDTLSKWYIKLIRDRVKDPKDVEQVLTTLTQVLYILCRRMAPFTPFLTEHIFQGLKPMLSDEILNASENSASVHYLLLPEPSECGVIDKDIERALHALQTVVTLGRVIRDQKVLGKRQPLNELVVVHEDPKILKDIEHLQSYIKAELNVHKITISNDKSSYGVERKALPDIKKLGKRLKGQMKPVGAAIKAMTENDIEQFVKNKGAVICGEQIAEDEIFISLKTAESASGEEKFVPNAAEGYCVLLDCELNEALKEEFTLNEIKANIQNSKKLAKLVPTDRVLIVFTEEAGKPAAAAKAAKKGKKESSQVVQESKQNLTKIAEKFSDNISAHVRSGFSLNTPDFTQLPFNKSEISKLYENSYTIGAGKFKIEIYGQEKFDIDLPAVKVKNMTLLLENPKGNKIFNEKDSENIFGTAAESLNKDNFKVEDIVTVKKVTGAADGKVSEFYILKENFDIFNNKNVKLENFDDFKRQIANLTVGVDRSCENVNVFSDEAKKQKIEKLEKVGQVVYI